MCFLASGLSAVELSELRSVIKREQANWISGGVSDFSKSRQSAPTTSRALDRRGTRGAAPIEPARKRFPLRSSASLLEIVDPSAPRDPPPEMRRLIASHGRMLAFVDIFAGRTNRRLPALPGRFHPAFAHKLCVRRSREFPKNRKCRASIHVLQAHTQVIPAGHHRQTRRDP